MLVLEGAQAGLSWDTILRRRESYRRAFDDFDPRRVARYDAAKAVELLQDPGIVRNRQKIASAISNAKASLETQREFGSFDAYLWRFVGGDPLVSGWTEMGQVPARTPRVGCPEQGPARQGLQFRGRHDLLRLHAVRRPGKRPPGRMLPVRRACRWRGRRHRELSFHPPRATPATPLAARQLPFDPALGRHYNSASRRRQHSRPSIKRIPPG